MCGIAGGWWKQHNLAQTHLPHALRAMRHRGPDDTGVEFYPFNQAVVALGQVRLSIIDLSAAGHQPMHSANGRWSIVFNGEIYNYRELRSELRALGHRFATETDTEVLLIAWMQWGQACLLRLVGMFAFVVLDKQAATLTCVRDAFGIKPFFYAAQEGSAFRFASELPALLKLLEAKPSLNWQRSYDYLVHGDYDSSPDTFYAGVHHLPPGHWLTVNLANGQPCAPQRWWMPDIRERSDWTYDDAVDHVRETFLHNIRLHLRSDVQLGAALSGGIDSSAVVCAMRHIEPNIPIHTFSYIAQDSVVNEEHWVDRVNQHVGAIPHKVAVNPQELARDLDDMIEAQGEPFGSTSIYAQYRVFKLAKENGITVTLDGQGADEMLAGYRGYPGQRLRSLIEKNKLTEAWHFFNEWSKWPGRSRLEAFQRLVQQTTKGSLNQKLRSLKGTPAVPAWLDTEALQQHGVITKYPLIDSMKTAKGRRVAAELAKSMTTQGLPSLLRHGDRNSMRFSIESRVPFLTIDLANSLLSMPEHFLISSNGETKHVFRSAMRGIVPDDILDRRDKIGFATPEQAWLTAMSASARKWLACDLPVPLLKNNAVLEEFDLIISGKKKFSWQVWRWINFYRWYGHHVLTQ